ncbi:MAG: hypothetical protein LAO06_11450 [Acidobacteriia bacterium]|nr:hypothetical protein [Terriglobia bacterium]
MEILNSWKEIANYLGRGVRTVQRWERDLGLPVHRPKGKDRSAVLAFPNELQAWLRRTPVRSLDWSSPAPNSGNEHGNGQRQNASWPWNGKTQVASLHPANGEPPRLAPGRVRTSIKHSDVHQSCARARHLRDKLLENTRRQQALAAELAQSVSKLTRVHRERATAGG